MLSIVLVLVLLLLPQPPSVVAAAAVRVVVEAGRIQWRVAEEGEEECGRWLGGWKPRAHPARCRIAAPPMSVLRCLGWGIEVWWDIRQRLGGGCGLERGSARGLDPPESTNTLSLVSIFVP